MNRRKAGVSRESAVSKKQYFPRGWLLSVRPKVALMSRGARVCVDSRTERNYSASSQNGNISPRGEHERHSAEVHFGAGCVLAAGLSAITRRATKMATFPRGAKKWGAKTTQPLPQRHARPRE